MSLTGIAIRDDFASYLYFLKKGKGRGYWEPESTITIAKQLQ
jgi:hypothetical protein